MEAWHGILLALLGTSVGVAAWWGLMRMASGAEALGGERWRKEG